MPFSDSPRGQTHGCPEHGDMPEETKEWWKKIYFGYLARNNNICIDEDDLAPMMEDIIAEANARRDREWRDRLERMIHKPQNRKESYRLKLKARNEAFNEAKGLFV